MKKISFLLVICILFTSVCNISFAKDVEREVYQNGTLKVEQEMDFQVMRLQQMVQNTIGRKHG